MARNYYVILGVDSDATQDQIKSAYRRKAKQLHPDHCEGSSKPFRDVQEAYEVLSDLGRRRTYDDELAREARPQVPLQGARAEPLRSRRCPVEPLVPTERSTGFREPSSDRFSYPPLIETLCRLWNDLDSLAWPRIEEKEGVRVTIPLTREQALRGGRVRVWISVRATCPYCWGYGNVGFYDCWECFGEGTILEQCPVWIAFPAGVSDHSVARVSLARLGAPNADLIVRFSVRGQ